MKNKHWKSTISNVTSESHLCGESHERQTPQADSFIKLINIASQIFQMSPVLKYPTNFCLDGESHERRTAQAADIQCYRYLTVKANIADKSFKIDIFLILTRTHSSGGLDENMLL